jgi:hypothetical protein
VNLVLSAVRRRMQVWRFYPVEPVLGSLAIDSARADFQTGTRTLLWPLLQGGDGELRQFFCEALIERQVLENQAEINRSVNEVDR